MRRGNGATSAVELLVDCLGIKNLCGSTDKRPAVFVGPYEHHSNLIPWRESGCEIVMIPECVESQNVDLKYLEGVLQHPKFANRVKMGTFTAASNVTGKVCDVNEISAILHKYKTLAFFDYATGAPYLSMDMNPPPTGQCSAADVSKDAIFLSPHKMIGGINTPGILILKKSLINQTNAPGRSGGGTVFYVTHTHHRFLSNRIERYEGGTPNVVGIMRVGLTFLVKRKMETELLKSLDKSSNNDKTPHSVLEYDLQTHDDVVKRLSQTAPNVILLGKRKDGRDNKNIPIFSFLVKCGERFLHYNYVCAILNDLFGIQSRGGCQCSGPYSQNLLGLTNIVDGKEVPSEANLAIENALLHFKERAELLRPGYTRLSLPFKGLSNEEAEFVLKALEWVAKNGWALMCQYRCNHRTGEWRHFSRQGKPLGRTERKWLSHFDMHEKTKFTIGRNSENLNRVLENTLDNANYQLLVARTEQRYIMQALKMSDDSEILKGDANLEKLRWYVYPKECAQVLKQGLLIVPKTYSNEIAGALRLDGLNQITPIDYATTNGKFFRNPVLCPLTQITILILELFRQSTYIHCD
jgi:selenocysteine lyase/cysteine desulfurase